MIVPSDIIYHRLPARRFAREQATSMVGMPEFLRHNSEGDRALRAGDFTAASAAYKRSISVAEAMGNPDLMAGAWNNIGQLEVRRKQYDHALAAFERALVHARSAGSTLGVATCLRNAAEAERLLGRNAMALARLAEARALYSARHHSEGIAACLRAEARNLESVGRLTQALDSYRQAKQLYAQLGNLLAEASCDHRIGLLLVYSEGAAAGRRVLELVVTTARRGNDRAFLVLCLNDLALTYGIVGRYAEAHHHLHEALELCRDDAALTQEKAMCLNNLGRIYLDQHDTSRAEGFFQQSLSILERKAGLERRSQPAVAEGLIFCLNNLARIRELAGDGSRAVSFVLRALEIARASANEAHICFCLCSVGRLLLSSGQFRAARERLMEALPLARSTGDERQRSEILFQLAHASEEIGEHEAARAFADEVLEIARAREEGTFLQACLELSSRILTHCGEPASARSHLEEALELAEERRSRLIGGQSARAAFFDREVSPHLRLIEEFLLPSPPEHGRAFEMLERAKSRALRDLFEQREHERLGRKGSPAAERCERLLGRLREVDFLLSDERPEQGGLIRSLLVERRSLEEQIASLLGQDLALGQPADDLVSNLRAAPAMEGSAVVELFVGHEQVVAFVIDGELPELKVVALPACPASRVRDWWRSWSGAYRDSLSTGRNHGFRAVMESVLPQAFEDLISPVLAVLPPTVHRLVFVPHQQLHAFPLHAAYREEHGTRRYLIEDYDVAYAPSASLLLGCLGRARTGMERFLGVSNPTGDLPFAAREVQEVAGLFQNAVVLGGEGGPPATREALIRHAAAADIVLCTGHGRSGTWSSAALLLQDGAMNVTEQFRTLELPVCRLWDSDVCESALGEPRRSDDWITLASAPLVAGAKTVWAALWEVKDDAAAALKSSAYCALIRASSPAAALNQAQRMALSGRLEWFQKVERRHPIYWAPFTNVGAPA